MQLTRFTDYSLRVLIAVGLAEGQGITIARIAERFDISKNHLMKVVHFLSQAGFLQTLRGRGGGLRLAVPPEKIGLADLIRATEADFNLVPCFDADGGDNCPIMPACVLKRALQRAMKEYFNVLGEYTLADLLRPAPKLRRLLLADTPAAPVRP